MKLDYLEMLWSECYDCLEISIKKYVTHNTLGCILQNWRKKLWEKWQIANKNSSEYMTLPAEQKHNNIG